MKYDENILQCGNNSAKKIKDVHLAYAALRRYKVIDMRKSTSSFPLDFAWLSVRKSINTDRNAAETKVDPFSRSPLKPPIDV